VFYKWHNSRLLLSAFKNFLFGCVFVVFIFSNNLKIIIQRRRYVRWSRINSVSLMFDRDGFNCPYLY
jgi:hypothetical protein